MATALLRPGTAPLINPYAPIPESPQLDGALGVGQAERGLRSAAFNNTAGEAATDYYKAQAAGDVPGAQAAGLRMQNYQQQAEKYAPRVQSVGDIHGVGDAADWAMGVAGQLPITLVPAMAGGLVGGGLGGALFRGAGAALGGHLGAGAAMYPQMRDAARMQQAQAEAQGAPALPAQQVLTDTSNQGMVQAHTEALVPGLASRSLLGQGAKAALTKPVGGALRRVGRDIALDSGAAGLSENVATSFETGRNPGRDTSGDAMRYVDAMASEAMGGGVMGAAGHAGDMAHTALGTGVQATGDAAAYAARLAEQGGAAGMDKAKELWSKRPKTLDEAAVMAGEGAAKLHTGAEDAVTRVLQRGKDADVDTLLSKRTDKTEGAMRADDAAKHQAATNFIAKNQANTGDLPGYVKAAMADYAAKPKGPFSWEPLADAVNDMHRAQGIGTAFKSFVDEASLKLGEGAAKLMNAKDDAVDTYRVKRETDKRANAQTPDMMLDIEAARDDLSPLLDEALAPLTGLKSQAALDNTLPSLAHGMRAWVENNFSMRKNGAPVVPSSLLNMFTDPAKAVQATVDLLHRQGLVDDSILPMRDLVLRQLEVKQLAREEAAVIVDEMLLPTQSHGLTAAQRRAVADDLMDRLPRDEVSTKEAKALFGPRARVALDALWAKINAARAREDDTVEVGDGRERSVSGLSDEGGSMKDDAGASIVPNLGAEDLEQITSSHLDKDAGKPEVAYHHYKPGVTDKTTGEIKPPEPYQQGGRVKNKDGSFTYHNAHAAKRTSDLQTVGASEVQRQGYLDYLREKHGGDFTAIARDFEALTNAKKDELLRLQNKTGRMETMADGSKQVVHDPLDKLVNKHFYVLREAAQRKMGEATNVDPKSLGREGGQGQIIGNAWAEKSDGEYGTTKHGRIWLERVNADGSTSPFATSTSRIIRRMTDARKAEGRVDESGGIAGQRTMLHQGLASLLTAEADGKPVLTGRVGFKETADGEVQWQTSGQDFPDSLRMHSTSGQTYKDAKAAVKRGRADEILTAAEKLLESPMNLKRRKAMLAAIETRDIEALDEYVRANDRVRDAEQGDDDTRTTYEHTYTGPFTTALDAGAVLTDKGLDPRRNKVIERKDEGFYIQHTKSTQLNTGEIGADVHETRQATRVETVARDNQGNKFGSKKIALMSAKEGDRVVKSGGKWVIERDIPTEVRARTGLPTEIGEMGKTSNVRSRQEDNTSRDARNVDETTNQTLHADERETAVAKSDREALAAKAEAAAAAKETRAQRTAFLLSALDKGIPSFNDMARKLSPERRAALLEHLKAMIEARYDIKAGWNPLWGGKPPKDFAAFANRARAALVALGEIKGATKKPVAKVEAAPAKAPTFAMNYRDGMDTVHKMRPEFKGKDTMDLILSGDRTATTGSLGRFKGAKKGDVVIAEGNGKQALIRFTSDPHPVRNMDAEAWSKLEGWAPSVLENYRGAYQATYELVNKPVATPAAPPAQRLPDVLKRMNDYLDNPPDDYNVKQLEAIRDWATKQEARLNEAKSKYKEGQDDEWERLDDLRFEATMLKAKATKAIKTEAEVEAHHAEQGGPRYNAMATRLHEDLGREGFAATHDSPIRHEGKFDWRSHIGKGEGNAAFGAGTYLSTANGVHQMYKAQFTGRVEYDQAIPNSAFKGIPKKLDAYFADMSDHVAPDPITQSNVGYVLNALRGFVERGKPLTLALKEHFPDGLTQREFDEMRPFLEKYGTTLFGDAAPPTYEVSVNIKPEQMLDWNKPLSEQSEFVQKALAKEVTWKKQKAWNGNTTYELAVGNTSFGTVQDAADTMSGKFVVGTGTYGDKYDTLGEAQAAVFAKASGFTLDGANIYKGLVQRLGSQAKASDYLQSLGILGHTYDASGGKNDKFRNHVIYDDSKITTNYVHFNKQDPSKAFGTAQAATPEEQAKFHADILRRLGPQMKSGLLEVLMGKNARGKDIYLSGKWEKGAIYASVYARNLDQIGAHEAFHEFFSRLRAEPAAADVLKVLDRAANSPYVTRQLERLLDGETEALKQIKQGAKHAAEERMAYMFQFHQAGLLKLGPETETVFQKIARFLRKVAGLINDDERADLLLRAFDRGEAQTADAAARVLANSVTARAQMYTRVNEASQPMLARASRLVNTAETNLERQGVEEYHTIRRLFKRSVGESGEQGYLDAKDHLMKQKSNELFKAFQDANGKDYAPADLALAAKYLHTGKKPTDPVVRDIVKKLTGPDGILPRMHKYLKDAGVMRWEADEAHPGKGEWVPMGKIDEKYFPRVYDTASMVTKPDEFVADLVKYNAAELNAIAAEQNALLAKSGVKDATPVTAEGVARGITNRLINAFGSELDENSSAVGFSPVMQAVNKRSLHWLAPEVLEKWGEKDVAKIMTSYVAQGIKRAEYVRRFGNGGEKLQDMLTRAHEATFSKLFEAKYDISGTKPVKERAAINARLAAKGDNDFGPLTGLDFINGQQTTRMKPTDAGFAAAAVYALKEAGIKADKADIEAIMLKALKVAKGAATDVMAMEGTLGYDIKPGMRRFQNSLLVYENMRLLSTSLFSQFIDPLGIVVRGGTMTDAWSSYKRGIREVIASIKGDPIKDLDAQIADQVGTTDANGFLAAFGQLYSSQYMGDKFRKANDVLFKYNGMEGFNRGMQVSATRAAINFIKRHATQPNDNSVDFLKELNLTAKDVVVDAKTGELDYTDPKIQQAIHQWVNGSIMRPNAAQRPAWGSDPHYMVFWHMKQFAYTFHDVIMKRAMFNYKTYGDMGPMGTLLMAYTPVMIATDALKGVLLSGGEEPGWMRAGLGSELQHGAMRAGLAGKFQPGVDVMGPHRTVLGLGGPAIEQIVQMFEKSPVDSAINALPGANVWNTMKGGPMVEMQGED